MKLIMFIDLSTFLNLTTRTSSIEFFVFQSLHKLHTAVWKSSKDE